MIFRIAGRARCNAVQKKSVSASPRGRTEIRRMKTRRMKKARHLKSRRATPPMETHRTEIRRMEHSSAAKRFPFHVSIALCIQRFDEITPRYSWFNLSILNCHRGSHGGYNCVFCESVRNKRPVYNPCQQHRRGSYTFASCCRQLVRQLSKVLSPFVKPKITQNAPAGLHVRTRSSKDCVVRTSSG